MNRKYIEMLAVLFACGLVVLPASPLFAQQKFLERVRKHYMLDRSNGKCDLCHELKPKEDPSEKNLNDFGKLIQADADMKPLLGKGEKYEFSAKELDVLEKVVAKHEGEDTDKDGATNKEELELGSYPANAKSVPDKAKLEKYRKDHPAKK